MSITSITQTPTLKLERPVTRFSDFKLERPVTRFSDLKPGDLFFFANDYRLRPEQPLLCMKLRIDRTGDFDFYAQVFTTSGTPFTGYVTRHYGNAEVRRVFAQITYQIAD